MHKKNRSAFFIISALYGASLFAIAFMFSLFSCSHEPIFWAIDREIKLREANVKGNVYSIILHRNHLYAANGRIYAKSLNSEGGWETFPQPVSVCTGNAARRTASMGTRNKRLAKN